MDLSHEHDRKGLVATILIHSIIFLLMLIWVMGEAKDMEEPAGGVEVSFGDPDAGGATDMSQVSNTTPSESSPSNPEPSTTENPDPVVTTDDADQPVMDNRKQETQKTKTTEPVKEPTKSQEPTISEAQKAMDRWKKNKQANSDKTSSTGDGTKDGPKGDPGAKQPGPGGLSSGTKGNFKYSLDGFGISSSPKIVNQSQDDGTVIVYFCINKNGQLMTNTIRISGGTASSTYLKKSEQECYQSIWFFTAWRACRNELRNYRIQIRTSLIPFELRSNT